MLLPLMKKTAGESDSDVRIVNVRSSWIAVSKLLSNVPKVSSLAHRGVPANPRYDSLETLNNDFSHTAKPETNLYGA